MFIASHFYLNYIQQILLMQIFNTPCTYVYIYFQ